MLFGPMACLKCTASHSTPAHRCFVISLVVKTGGFYPTPPPGYWALCTLLSCDSAPFLSCGKFPSGVRQGAVVDFHLSGPCPRGPCGAGGLLDLPLVPLAGRGQHVPPPLAGRAVAVFLILSPSPQSPHSRIGDDLVALPPVVHEAGPEHLAPASSSCCRLPSSSPPGILPNKYDAIMQLRLPFGTCGDAVGATPNRAVVPSLVTHHALHLRKLHGCWIVEALKTNVAGDGKSRGYDDVVGSIFRQLHVKHVIQCRKQNKNIITPHNIRHETP